MYEILGNLTPHDYAAGHTGVSKKQHTEGFTHAIESPFPDRCDQLFIERDRDVAGVGIAFYLDPNVQIVIGMVAVAGHSVGVGVRPLADLHDVACGLIVHSNSIAQRALLVNRFAAGLAKRVISHGIPLVLLHTARATRASRPIPVPTHDQE